LYCYYGGWIVPIRVAAFKGDEWIDADIADFLEDGKLKVYYRRKRVAQNRWVLAGKFEAFHKNGSKAIEGTYKDGSWHGPMTFHHENGQIAYKSVYDHGLESGVSIFWDEKGNKKWERNYSEGLKHGREIYWNSEGDIFLTIHFIEGTIVQIELFKNGKVDKTLVDKEAKIYWNETFIKVNEGRIDAEILDGARSVLRRLKK